MGKFSLRTLAMGAALSLAFVGSASATMIVTSSTNTINFSAGWPGLNNTNLGSHYSFPGTGLTAFALVPQGGWTGSNCSDTASEPCLFYKYTAGNPVETGLGLQPDPTGDNEIFYPNGIGLIASSGYISGLELGSVQSGESWQVLGCTENGGCTHVLGAGVGGSSNNTVTLTGFGNGGYFGYVVDVPCPTNDPSCTPGTGVMDPATSGGDNILVMSVTTVPEPGTLALFAAGLLGCGLLLRRRARQS
jgi:hypothetical protein